MKLEQLCLQIDLPLVHPQARNFRPASWPPPPDWSPILDAEGVAQCVYSDSVWPLDVWAGKPLKLNFGDGHKRRSAGTDKPNADLLRQCAVWFLFGPRGCRNPASLVGKLQIIKPIFVVCAEERIVATDLRRFPKVIDKVTRALAPSNFDYAITILHELLDARDDLGFCLFDKDGLARLVTLRSDREIEQTPYIPPRIWTYQLSRLRECLTIYLKHREQVEACFQFCLDSYAKNYGSLKQAVNSKVDGSRPPFQNRTKRKRKGCIFHGSFKKTADRFGVTALIEQWVGPYTGKKGEHQITVFSQYLDLVSKVGFAYLLNFSLMRIEEGWNLRSDCLMVEQDESFGDIHMLRGETTKTDQDADARWPVSESVKLAIEAMKHIAELRMRCARERDGIGLTSADKANPYLLAFQYEPWGCGRSQSYRLRPAKRRYAQMTEFFPLLFDAKQLTITENDLRLARLITPSLNQDEFKVGEKWKFAWHQLRRTGAVNMLSSDMVDEPSLQFLLKHQSRVMTLYYGRNHSRLNLDRDTRTLFLKTMYQEFGRELRELQSPQFVSPLGPERKAAIVHFIKETEATALDKAARQGKIGARRIRAGFCVKNRSCPYGGHEAIAHCLGGDDGKGCPELLVDIKKEPDIRAYEGVIDDQLSVVHPDSPRHNRLQAEKRAISKYYEITATQNG
ncbi:MAG: hypothetical protein HY273_10695 [Gammaproteobacteria bacterium]|nr:hypothetical protein [Gammaproteobacteria bacterium]